MARLANGRCCRISGHPQQRVIEKLIVVGIPNREISKRYGISEATIRRHKKQHMEMDISGVPAMFANNGDIPDIQGKLPAFDDIASWIGYIRDRTIRILDVTENQENYRESLGALRELRGNLELMMKGAELLLAYKSSHDIERVIEVILDVLAPYPDIKDEVAETLRKYGL